jgi:hypothetical protein
MAYRALMNKRCDSGIKGGWIAQTASTQRRIYFQQRGTLNTATGIFW